MQSFHDPSETLSFFASTLVYDRLPSQLVKTIKRIIFDTIGTTLAGTTLGSSCPEFVDVIRETGGNPESTLIGFDARTSAPMAALANGATAHALNFDDVFPGGGHLGVVTFPAALALAERKGRVTGRQFIAAIAAGAEVAARMQIAVRNRDAGTNEAKPQPTQMLGAFGATASAVSILGIDAKRAWSAFGLALMQANGNRQPVVQGAPAKALYAAFPNQTGVMSALLAQRGVGAECDAFLGEAGFYPTCYGSNFDPDPLTDRLWTDFFTLDVGFKPWPTTNRAHAFIEAAQNIAASRHIDPALVERIDVRGAPHIRTFCEPLETRRHPQSWVQAEDSVLFSVAKALVNHRVVLADFGPEGLQQPAVVALGDRLNYSLDPAMGGSGEVRVQFTDGSHLVERVEFPLGHPRKPMSDADLERKFFDCGSHAANKLTSDRLQEILETVNRLDTLPNVRVLADLLSNPVSVP